MPPVGDTETKEAPGMAPKLSRRNLLIGASGALAATALGGLGSRFAFASEPRSLARNSAFAAIDQSLRQAVASKTVTGVVAVGATQQGVVYQGSFGSSDIDTGSPMAPDDPAVVDLFGKFEEGLYGGLAQA
jgi:methyl acetate hydrolase